MDNISFRTKHLNPQTATHEWLLIDADNQVLGRLATKIATYLMGKHKSGFTSHTDCGDHVVVINAAKVRMTGKKLDQKEIVTFTGYPGGRRVKTPREALAHRPVTLIEEAVRGMLPKTRLGADIFRKLHVSADASHKFAAQKPKAITL